MARTWAWFQIAEVAENIFAAVERVGVQNAILESILIFADVANLKGSPPEFEGPEFQAESSL